MTNANGDPSSTKRARKLVTGVAWTFLILSAWFCLRTLLTLFVSQASNSNFEGPLKATFGQYLKPILYTHAFVAAFTFFAALALLRYQPWSRLYFTGLFFLLAFELGYMVGIWIWDSQNNPNLSVALMGIQTAIGVAFVVMAVMAALLGWKFLKDKAIRTLFNQN